jgi:hypothetical protein
MKCLQLLLLEERGHVCGNGVELSGIAPIWLPACKASVQGKNALENIQQIQFNFCSASLFTGRAGFFLDASVMLAT